MRKILTSQKNSPATRFAMVKLTAVVGLLAGFAMAFTGCSAYQPLRDEPGLYHGPRKAPPGPGITAEFQGNTTILVSDGTTHLLVDGFYSRPSGLRTIFGRIASDPKVVGERTNRLKESGIDKLDAVLVGHAHHDHSLDAPYVAAAMGNAPVMGSQSYAFIHQGAALAVKRPLITVGCGNATQKFGKFTVRFLCSDHVGAHSFLQRMVEGHITAPLQTPAHFSKFKCGDVYAIHISHPRGSIAVTTTAGARSGQFKGLRADVIFLGIGFLSKEPKERREKYWHETVGTLGAHTVIPVHWDDFSKKLSPTLRPRPRVIENTRASIRIVKDFAKAERCRVMLLGLDDSIRLVDGSIK